MNTLIFFIWKYLELASKNAKEAEIIFKKLLNTTNNNIHDIKNNSIINKNSINDYSVNNVKNNLKINKNNIEQERTTQVI